MSLKWINTSTGFQLFTQSNGLQGVYADAAARDVYFGANPDDLAICDANPDLIIKLLDDGGGQVAYQQRQAGVWVDVTSLVQGEVGPAGATGNSFFFESIVARDAFFNTGTNYALLMTGLPVQVNEGTVATVYYWSGADSPPSYDADLFRPASVGSSPGSLFLGSDGLHISSAARALNVNDAYGQKSVGIKTRYDETGNLPSFTWEFGASSVTNICPTFSTQLAPPFEFLFPAPVSSDAMSFGYSVRPATSGELRVKIYAGSDNTGGVISDTTITVEPGDVGTLFDIALVNQIITQIGDDVFAEYSGIDLFGGVQASGAFVGQTKPYLDADFSLLTEIIIVHGPDGTSSLGTIPFFTATDGHSLGSDDGFLYDDTLKTLTLTSAVAGSGTMEFLDSSDVLKGTIRYLESADEFRIDAYNGLSEIIINDVVEVFKGTNDGRIDIEANTNVGSALLTLSAAAGGTGLSLEYDDGADESYIIAEMGHLTIGTDGADTNITLSPDGGVGIKIDPTAGYSLDVYAAGTDIVGLYSSKAVTLEVGAYGNADSTNLIFNKGDVGTNQSEFVLYNDNNATALARHFRMGYADDIATSGGLTVWKERNNVAVGTYSEPDGVFTVSENTTETGDQAGITIIQEGTGDAILQFLLGGSGQRWVVGAANAGGDAFEISSSLNLGSDTRFIINTTGEAKIPLSLMVGDTANPVSPLHVYQDDAVTGTGGGITVEQDGGGDAMVQYLLTGGVRWVTGIDNSDNDTYKIAKSTDLGVDTVFKLLRNNGVCLTFEGSSTDNWLLSAGLELINENAVDGTYSSVVNRGFDNLAAGMLFKNDDYSENYSHIIFGARDANGFEENALIIKPAHTEIVNSTNTPYGGRGQVQNRLTYSQELDNAMWAPGSTNPPVVTANNAIAPDGTMTADTLSFPGPGAGLIRQGTLGLIEDDTYNVSGWVRHVSGGTQLTARLDTDNTAPWIANSRWQRFSSDIVQGGGGPWFDLFAFAAHAPATFEVWGLQISDGAGSKPYLKTGELALLTQTQGATVNNDLYVSDSIYKNTHEVGTKGPEVVEVWSLDDFPQDSGDVVPEYKLYRFMQEIDWGTTRMRLENDAYALFEGIDVFVTSQTYSGTLPWIYGEGTIRCVGNGMTWKMTGDNATMFDITAGGWGMDYSTLMTTGDNCSLGTIVAPSVSDPLLGTRFISTRSLFQGFKTGLTLVNPGAVHVDISFFYDADDAVGPMLTIDGLTKAAIIEATEVTLASASSSFLHISPIVKRSVNLTNITLADGQTFFDAGTTGAITLFADASVASETIVSVTDSSGVARFNFAAPPTLFVGQEVVIVGFLSNPAYNGTHIITATGAGYFEVSTIDFGTDDSGSFTSNSVTVTSAAHGLSDEGQVLISDTLEYNAGSIIYNTQTNTFQINAVWDTAETSGTWDDGSLTEASKYVTSQGNGTQRDSKKLASVFVSANTTATSITGTGTYDPLNLVAALIGSATEEFTMIDAATGEVRYDGVNHFEGVLQASISAYKTGGAVVYRFRAFKTVGTPALDAVTVTRSVTTTIGSITLVMSVSLEPGDQFRIEVETQGATNDLIISDFAMVVE